MKFSEWLLKRESSAFTRTRLNAALGLGPSIPDAEINSRSTAPKWIKDRIKKRNKKKHKKHEAIHHDIDNWFSEIEKLMGDIKILKDKIKNKEKEPKKDKSVDKPI